MSYDRWQLLHSTNTIPTLLVVVIKQSHRLLSRWSARWGALGTSRVGDPGRFYSVGFSTPEWRDSHGWPALGHPTCLRYPIFTLLHCSSAWILGPSCLWKLVEREFPLLPLNWAKKATLWDLSFVSTPHWRSSAQLCAGDGIPPAGFSNRTYIFKIWDKFQHFS